MPEEKTEWVTINKSVLEMLMQSAEKDIGMKAMVEKMRQAIKRGGGKASVWIDPLPRSAEG